MPPDLAGLQAWFLTAIMTPGGVQRGLALAAQRHGLAEHEVLRSPGGSGSRLHIYADGYVLRLLECMRADFPVLARTMGPELFDFFAKAYVWRHPSRSTTLYDLGRGFADFLAASLPPEMDAALALECSFPAELARLERALGEAARAPGLEALAPPAFDGIALLSGFDASVRLAPCTRLLALPFPVQAWWREVLDLPDEADLPPRPAPAPVFLAVGRLHYRTSVHVLAPWQFHFLQAAAAGAPARACALQAAQACGLAPAGVLADAMLWLPLAAAAALVMT